MSIEDQENNRKLQKQILDDINKLDNFALNQQELQKSINQKLKHNFNNNQGSGGKRINDSHAAAIPSDHHYTEQQVYADDGTLPCNGASCNYCKGSIEDTTEGRIFVHEGDCVF